MRKLQIAVVDDMLNDREWLTDRINNYCSIRDVDYTVHPYSSGEAFVAALKDNWFDIVFMDIYMDGISGVEAARALRAKDKDCKLVFLTISEDFMREGFSLNSAHYLVKPVKDEDFLQAMENCRIRRCCQVPLLTVISDRRTLRIATKDILYVDINMRSVIVHTKTESLPIGRNFSPVAENLLADDRFLLCNRGLLVNMDFIVAQTGNDFLLSNGERLPMAPRRRKELIAQHHRYTFNSLEN